MTGGSPLAQPRPRPRTLPLTLPLEAGLLRRMGPGLGGSWHVYGEMDLEKDEVFAVWGPLTF